MKITNSDVIKELNLPKDTFYSMKKKYPRRIELFKKGICQSREN